MVEQVQVLRTDSFSHEANKKKIERDEAELKALMEQAFGKQDDEDSVQQEATEETAEEVDNTEAEAQKEKVKAEPKEEPEDEGLSAEEKSFKKRYSDIRRHMQEKDAEYKAEIEALKAKLDKSQNNELVLPKSEEEIEAWAKKYPDVAGIIEAIADRKASEKSSDLDKRLKEIEEMRVQARKEKAEATLLNEHPDFYEIRADDAFHEWAAKQSDALQKALYDDPDNVKDVAWAIRMYKTDMGIKSKKASPDKDAAASVKSKRVALDADSSKGRWTESQVAKMSAKEYEKNMDSIQEAMRSGNFIYDLSKR
jgi:hypothetical protein